MNQGVLGRSQCLMDIWWIICKKHWAVLKSHWYSNHHGLMTALSTGCGDFGNLITLNGNQILPFTSPTLNNHGLETCPPPPERPPSAPTSTSCTFVSNCGTYGEKGKSTVESWRMTLHYEPGAILYRSLLMSLVDWNRIGIKLSER